MELLQYVIRTESSCYLSMELYTNGIDGNHFSSKFTDFPLIFLIENILGLILCVGDEKNMGYLPVPKLQFWWKKSTMWEKGSHQHTNMLNSIWFYSGQTMERFSERNGQMSYFVCLEEYFPVSQKKHAVGLKGKQYISKIIWYYHIILCLYFCLLVIRQMSP